MSLILFSHRVELDHSFCFSLRTHRLSLSSSRLVSISMFISSIVEFNLRFEQLLFLLDAAMQPTQARFIEVGPIESPKLIDSDNLPNTS